jgi:hypothetical protein
VQSREWGVQNAELGVSRRVGTVLDVKVLLEATTAGAPDGATPCFLETTPLKGNLLALGVDALNLVHPIAPITYSNTNQ